MSRKRRRNQRQKLSHRTRWTIGWILSEIQMVITLLFLVMVCRFAIFPVVYLFLIAGVLICIWGIPRLLMGNGKVKVRYWAGAISSVLVSVILLILVFFMYRVYGVAEAVTGSETETTVINVYVLDEDPAQTLRDAIDYDFGILETLGREDTDEAIEEINDLLNTEISMYEFENLSDIADALYAGTTPAIILSEAYVDVITETDGYETFEDDIRILTSYEWETEIEQTDVDGDVFVVYISGIDASGSISTKSRSDVNILAVVNRDTHQIQLISTPRDYYVELSISNGVKDKLTHAGIYGIQVSMDTLEMLYDIEVDYYFRINFTGFVELIDALGGVTVTSEVAFSSGEYTFVVGENYMDGEAALAFVRERKSFSDGDRQRGRNQMALISGVIAGMQSMSFLRNFNSFLNGVESSFETSVSYDLAAEMVRNQIADGESWNVGTYSVDGTGSTNTTYSMNQMLYVMVPDETTVEHAKELIQNVVNGGEAGS